MKLIYVRDRAAFWFALSIIYWIVAGAAFNGYYQKWQFYDGQRELSVVATIDGVADRPFVYRQLLPQIANGFERVIPLQLAEKLEQRLVTAEGALTSPDGAEAEAPGFTVRYRIVYYLSFLSLFAAFFVLRQLGLEIGLNSSAASVAPPVFGLMIPVLQSGAGFFYDFPELLFFALASIFAWRGNIILFLLTVSVATINKEATFFFVIALFPLLKRSLGLKSSTVTLFVSLFISGLIYIWIKSHFVGNPSPSAHFQLWDNLAWYSNPFNLFMTEVKYGVPWFRGYSIVVLGWFFLLIYFGWRSTPLVCRQHFTLAAAINIPLLLLFCGRGEMRNLSLLYVAIVMFIAGAIHRLMLVPEVSTTNTTSSKSRNASLMQARSEQV